MFTKSGRVQNVNIQAEGRIMVRHTIKVDRALIVSRTDHGHAQIEDALRRAKELQEDPRKEERLKKHECKACFYLRGRIGAAAMTRQDCGICGKEQMFGSSCTDVICPECAKANQLCRRCGADLELRTRRRNFDLIRPTNG